MTDAEFDQLLADLRDAPARIEAQLAAVPADGWDDVVHEGEGGFTRRQILAHVASNDQRQMTRVRVGSGIGGPADEADLAAQADLDVWNREQVEARAGRMPAELIAEMHARRREFLALLESLSPEQRSRPIPFRGRTGPLTELAALIVEHGAGHAREIAG